MNNDLGNLIFMNVQMTHVGSLSISFHLFIQQIFPAVRRLFIELMRRQFTHGTNFTDLNIRRASVSSLSSALS